MSNRKILYHCPLCEWAHEDKSDDECMNETIPSAFGIRVLPKVAMNNRAMRIERALEEHLATHTTVEWVRQISRLQEALVAAQADVIRMDWIENNTAAIRVDGKMGLLNREIWANRDSVDDAIAGEKP